MANKSKTSKAWMHEHVNDNFVHLAKQQGWRSRAIFKLQEIDQKDNLINTNQKNFCVVDLGAAPGSWSQYVAKKLDSQLLANFAKIIAVDLLEISPISGVNFIHGDFTDDKILQQIVDLIPTEDKKVNLVISDMAPNISGIANIDQARSSHLCDLALDFCQNHLTQNGGKFLIKCFQGSYYNDFVNAMKQSFQQVLIRKPKASRSRSNEIYLLGKNLKA